MRASSKGILIVLFLLFLSRQGEASPPSSNIFSKCASQCQSCINFVNSYNQAAQSLGVSKTQQECQVALNEAKGLNATPCITSPCKETSCFKSIPNLADTFTKGVTRLQQQNCEISTSMHLKAK